MHFGAKVVIVCAGSLSLTTTNPYFKLIDIGIAYMLFTKK